MATFHYGGFGLRIDSDLELPELRTVPRDGDAPGIEFRLGAVPRIRRRATMDEETVLNIIGAAFLIRGGREIIIDPDPGVDPVGLRVALLGRVMALLLRQRGWLPLHASGVVLELKSGVREGVLFLGPSGAGKSTTAAAFHRRGHLVAGDDVVPVRIDQAGVCVLQPAGSYLRLTPDASRVLGNEVNGEQVHLVDAGSKLRYQLNRTLYHGAIPVRRAFVLEYGQTLGSASIPRMSAILSLSRNSFVRHRNMGKEALAMHLRACTSVAGAIPVCRLIRPRSLDALADLVSFVERDCL